MFPPPFERQMQALLGPEYPAFAEAMRQAAPVSVRLNPAKTPAPDAWRWPGELTPVPWHPQGRYLSERPVFTLDPLLHAGAYYVQEASSMFLHEALRQAADCSKPLKVLDLCAAPGGKSTLLAALLHPGSLLVANEVVRTRVSALRENLEKWGCPNVAVSCAEPADFATLDGWFDVLVADAPCSGEGLFRKDPAAVGEWSAAHAEACALRQQRILTDALPALAPGGLLAYSTCTFNRLENEANAAWLCAYFDLEPVRLSLPPDWSIVETDGGYRFFPQHLRGEGFFLALFRKKSGLPVKNHAAQGFKNLQPLAKKYLPDMAPWFGPEADLRFFQTSTGDVQALPVALLPAYETLDKVLKSKWFGVTAGAFKGADFVPAHALALSTPVAPGLPAVALSREQAQLFLKKEVFDLPSGAPRAGWALARYGGLNLGWMKILPNRWNNYLPAERRIRMEL